MSNQKKFIDATYNYLSSPSKWSDDHGQTLVWGIHPKNNTVFYYAWWGRKTQPRAVFTLKSTKFSNTQNVIDWLRSRVVIKAAQAKRKRDQRKAKQAELAEKLKPGTVLVRSWGYDQTNVDYFRVITQKSPTQFWVVPVASNRIETERVIPTGEVNGDPVIGRLSGERVVINGEHFSIWSGTPNYATHPYNYR